MINLDTVICLLNQAGTLSARFASLASPPFPTTKVSVPNSTRDPRKSLRKSKQVSVRVITEAFCTMIPWVFNNSPHSYAIIFLQYYLALNFLGLQLCVKLHYQLECWKKQFSNDNYLQKNVN